MCVFCLSLARVINSLVIPWFPLYSDIPAVEILGLSSWPEHRKHHVYMSDGRELLKTFFYV